MLLPIEILIFSRWHSWRRPHQLDDEAAPHAYSQFVWYVLRQVLRSLKKERRLALVNRLVELLAAQDGLQYVGRKKLLKQPKQLLRFTAS